MKQILVAGAGHGGLVAAAMLSRHGYAVTVVEAKKKEDLGHDWDDRFSFGLLSALTSTPESDFPEGSVVTRGDCTFISPRKRKEVVVRFDENNRHRLMDRKALLSLLLKNAESAGVNFLFETAVLGPLTADDRVTGLSTARGDMPADLVIDAAGVFSPVRMNLPESFGIEKTPKRGDLFYAWRGYIEKNPGFDVPDAPHEVYLLHEGEPGLSWFTTFDDHIDVLIGRVDPLTPGQVDAVLEGFRRERPWMGKKLLRGGEFAVIPVRRPLTVMVGNGYAAVGDAAFMTTPMNGMGIDLSLRAGALLARTVLWNRKKGFTAEGLWGYNRSFHRKFGGDAAKNAWLKNALLAMDPADVDFLFEADVIEASDLSGAGGNTDLQSLLGKLRRGMKNPSAFFSLLGGVRRGAKAAKLYKNAPLVYVRPAVEKWSRLIEALDPPLSGKEKTEK